MADPKLSPEAGIHLAPNLLQVAGASALTPREGCAPNSPPPGPVSVSPLQDLKYIFIPSDVRDYIMLRSAIQGSPVPEGSDKGDE